MTAPAADPLRPNQRRILAQLASDGGLVTTRQLKTSNREMLVLYYRRLVNGAGSWGWLGWGMTPETSWWQITERGQQVLHADNPEQVAP